MKYLVTGGSGFIGKFLITELLKHGNLVSEAGRNASGLKVKDFIQISNASSDTSWIKPLQGCDVVIHLAARVHIFNQSQADFLAIYREVNSYNTINLAKQAAEAGVKRFVFVSTIKVNGEKTKESPFTEANLPCPQESYSVSKFEAEQALRRISQETSMEVVILRPPLVYGPGVKANFYNLLKIVSKGLPLPLKSINNLRSMIYVENLVSALVLCATHPNAANKIYLVCDGENISTPSLINKLAVAMKRPSRLFSVPIMGLHVIAMMIGRGKSIERLTESLVIDSGNIRRELQWIPPYSLSDGLQATADWYISTYKKNKV